MNPFKKLKLVLRPKEDSVALFIVGLICLSLALVLAWIPPHHIRPHIILIGVIGVLNLYNAWSLRRKIPSTKNPSKDSGSR
jgi:hypothetical protein